MRGSCKMRSKQERLRRKGDERRSVWRNEKEKRNWKRERERSKKALEYISTEEKNEKGGRKKSSTVIHRRDQRDFALFHFILPLWCLVPLCFSLGAHVVLCVFLLRRVPYASPESRSSAYKEDIGMIYGKRGRAAKEARRIGSFATGCSSCMPLTNLLLFFLFVFSFFDVLPIPFLPPAPYCPSSFLPIKRLDPASIPLIIISRDTFYPAQENPNNKIQLWTMKIRDSGANWNSRRQNETYRRVENVTNR